MSRDALVNELRALRAQKAGQSSNKIGAARMAHPHLDSGKRSINLDDPRNWNIPHPKDEEELSEGWCAHCVLNDATSDADDDDSEGNGPVGC